MEPEEGSCEPHGQVPEHVTLGFPRYFPGVHALQLEVPLPEKPSLHGPARRDAGGTQALTTRVEKDMEEILLASASLINTAASL